jgi:hypothetical protein
VGVDEDVRDIRVVQVRLDRTESKGLVEDLLFERGAFRFAERNRFLGMSPEMIWRICPRSVVLSMESRCARLKRSIIRR